MPDAKAATSCPICGPALLDHLQQSPARLARWGALQRVTVKRGQVLLRTGETPGALWWVEQGLLRASFLDASGRERSHAFYPEQHWLGLPGVPQPSPVTLDALEPSRLCVLPYAALQRWQADEPGLAELLWQGLSTQVQRLTTREQQWLMLDASQRYQRFLLEEPELARRLKQRHLASHLGITDVALSRIRRRLREQAELRP
jgi:CRP-like cAMP-binding protein